MRALEIDRGNRPGRALVGAALLGALLPLPWTWEAGAAVRQMEETPPAASPVPQVVVCSGEEAPFLDVLEQAGENLEVPEVPAQEASVQEAPGFAPVEVQLQNPELPNGCEVTSLAMVLTAAGYPVDKLELYSCLPREDFTYGGNNRFGPDPQTAFAGDAASASGGWYCLEGPILQAGDAWLQAQDGGACMVDYTGLSRETLDALLEEGTPLAVWVTQEYAPPAYASYFPWTLPDGSTYIPYDNLHCVVAAGIEGDAYRVADPIRGWQLVDQETFWQSFDAMGRRAVTVGQSARL